VTIWTFDSVQLEMSGEYRDGISQGFWTWDGATDNAHPNNHLTDPSHGPQGFRSFPMGTYSPRGPDPFPFQVNSPQ
jgi:hypothetical protein